MRTYSIFPPFSSAPPWCFTLLLTLPAFAPPQVCPFCRPGSPCEQCSGSCPVCKNEIAPGPAELLSLDGYRSRTAAKLATFCCVAEEGLPLRKAPSPASDPMGFPWDAHAPLKDDLVTGELAADGDWLKVFVRGIGDMFLPLREPHTGRPALEPFGDGNVVWSEGDAVRIRDVDEEEAERAMEGNGGWVPGMGAHLGSFAYVFEVLDDAGQVRLRHGGTTVWVWAVSLLVRVRPGSESKPRPRPPAVVELPWVGEPVCVKNADMLAAEAAPAHRRPSSLLAPMLSLQDGHGGWNEPEKRLQLLSGGQPNPVEAVWRDGTVQVCGLRWSTEVLHRINPAFVPPLKKPGVFALGDQVRLKRVGWAEAKRLQRAAGIGWWPASMELMLGLHGVVEDVNGRGHVTLRGERWHPDLVEHACGGGFSDPVGSLLAGEAVRIREVSSKAAEELQDGAGWSEDMHVLLGAVGTVDTVFASGNVQVFGKVWVPCMLERAGPLVNDEGAAVEFGSTVDGQVFCGRTVTAEGGAEPFVCGPEEGPACKSCERWYHGPREFSSSLGHAGFWTIVRVGQENPCNESCVHGPEDIVASHWSCCGGLIEVGRCVAGAKHPWHPHRLVMETRHKATLDHRELEDEDNTTSFGNVKMLDGVKNGGALVVLSPSTRARAAGLEAGDELVSIDGVNCRQMPMAEFLPLLVGAFKGKRGEAQLSVLRWGPATEPDRVMREKTAGIITDREKVLQNAEELAAQFKIDDIEQYHSPAKDIVADGAFVVVMERHPDGVCAAMVMTPHNGEEQVVLIHADGLAYLGPVLTVKGDSLPTAVRWVGSVGTHPVFEVTFAFGDGSSICVLKRFKDFKHLHEKVGALTKVKRSFVNPFPPSSFKSKLGLLGVTLSDKELTDRAALLSYWLAELRFLGCRENWAGWQVQAALGTFLERPSPEALAAADQRKAGRAAEQQQLAVTFPDNGAALAPDMESLATYDAVFREPKLGLDFREGGEGDLPKVSFNEARAWPAPGDVVVAVNGAALVSAPSKKDETMYDKFERLLKQAGKPVTLTFGFERGFSCAGCASPDGCRGRGGGGQRHLCTEGCSFDLCQECFDLGASAPPLFGVGESVRLKVLPSTLGAQAQGALRGATEVVIAAVEGPVVVAHGALLSTQLLERPRGADAAAAARAGASQPGHHPWHAHELRRLPAGHTCGAWGCDGHFFPGGCRTNTVRASPEDECWRCEACGFYLCGACWNLGQLAPLDLPPGCLVRVRDVAPATAAHLQAFVGPVPPPRAFGVLEEGVEAARPRAATSAEAHEVIGAFKVFDPRGTGAISVGHLRKIMGTMGDEPMSAEEINEAISEAEVDSNGNIKYKSLVKTMMGEEDGGGDGVRSDGTGVCVVSGLGRLHPALVEEALRVGDRVVAGGKEGAVEGFEGTMVVVGGDVWPPEAVEKAPPLPVSAANKRKKREESRQLFFVRVRAPDTRAHCGVAWCLAHALRSLPFSLSLFSKLLPRLCSTPGTPSTS